MPAKRVQAFEATDKSLHSTAEKANEHSARIELAKVFGGNNGVLSEVMKAPRQVYDALHHMFGGGEDGSEA